jgi:predicted ATPase
MGIKSLEIKGFRSLREVRWEPGRLNVLIGPNASGKSNLLDACELLQESVRGKLDEGIISRGGLTPLLWDGQERDVTWHLITDGNPAFTYCIGLQRLGNTGEYRIDVERLLAGENQILNRETAASMPHQVLKSKTLLSLMSSPFGEPAVHPFRKEIEGWLLYHDLRVDRGSHLRQASVARVEEQIAPDGQNLIPVLHTLYSGHREFRRSVDTAMHAAFEDYEELIFPPAADQRVQLRLRWRSLKTEQSAANLSDGTLRFLILVAILANPDPGSLIAIDEPETGLHPRMLSILAELAQEASERTQVVFTTHSPQLLDAFTGEPPTTTVAEWTDGETRLTNVDGEELRRWLSKYSLGSLFRSGELEALASAGATRKSLTGATSSAPSRPSRRSRSAPI